MLETLSGFFFMIGILLISLTIFIESFAESVTKCRKRISDAENECKNKVKVAQAEAIAARQELKDKNAEIEELSAKNKTLETENKKLQNALNEFSQKEKQNVSEPQPTDAMYEKYKELCEKEKSAMIMFANEIESSLKEKTDNLLEGIKEGRLHNYFLQDKDYYFTDLEIKARVRNIDALSDKDFYTTELHQCDCFDKDKNHTHACKHMQFLAYSLGILQLYRNKHQADFDKMILDAKKAKKDDKSNDKSKKSPSLSNKNKNISSELRGSEEDM